MTHGCKYVGEKVCVCCMETMEMTVCTLHAYFLPCRSAKKTYAKNTDIEHITTRAGHVEYTEMEDIVAEMEDIVERCSIPYVRSPAVTTLQTAQGNVQSKQTHALV